MTHHFAPVYQSLSLICFCYFLIGVHPTSWGLFSLLPGFFLIVYKDRIDFVPALPRKEIHVLARRQSLQIHAKIHTGAGAKRCFVLAGCADNRVRMVILQLQLNRLTSRADIPRILFIILMQKQRPRTEQRFSPPIHPVF